MSGLTLGLDLGPNSIGWALIDQEQKRIVGLGARVFPEGVDNFDSAKEVSRNEGRRIARGMRRQSQRRSRRKRILREGLVEAGLLPADPAAQQELLCQDPYELRARALREKLTPHQLGRVLMHLSQRRGFLSNRKIDRGDKEVKGMLAEIKELGAEMAGSEGAGKTLGELLADKLSRIDHANRQPNDHVRNRHTDRPMYEEEFERIWEAQRDFGHADLLTDKLKHGESGRRQYPCKPMSRRSTMSRLKAFGIHGLIFFQRRMYWPKSAVGLCELEPKQPRCARADRHAQRFRMLQEVNNLRYIDLSAGNRNESPLSAQQRVLLLSKLGGKDRMTFDQIRNALGFTESVRFNLEKGKRPYLLGMVVDAAMAKATGAQWHDRPEEQKDEIVRVLINNEREDDAILRRAQEQWGMTAEQAASALDDVDFPAGYLHLSLKAIDRLLVPMEKGLVYQSISDPEHSALHAAGYLRRDELRRRIFDTLPDPARARDCPIGDIPNPVVKRTLVELRKLVNAIVREYGKPDAVHVEMGRDVKSRPRPGTEAYRKYQEGIAEMREREHRRDRAKEKIRENNVKPTREAVTRYLLWEDQNYTCIYSGVPISVDQLFGGEVDVDHIFPYSRSLDDSQNNKVVCFRSQNHDKRDHTPYEWLADNQPDRYEQICQRASKWMKEGRISYAKYRRFLQKELELDDFIERQLNDTRYIARATGEYLRCLFGADHRVLGLKGQLTAELRWQWGIDTLLSELPNSPAWQKQSNLRPGEKNRADHRHHALDAVVLALTDRKRLQQLSQIRRESLIRPTGEILFDPWPEFRCDLKAALALVHVSHRVERRVRGELHEKTLYGRTETDGHWVARKPVEELSLNEIGHIRDLGVQRIIIERLREFGVEYGRGKKPDAKTWKQAMADLKMPSGVPIKKVRVKKSETTIQPIRKGTPDEAFVKPGSNHHVCLFEWEKDGKIVRDAEYVSLLEAARRLKDHETVVRRQHSTNPNARFLMSLCPGDSVLIEQNGQDRLMIVSTLVSTQKRIHLVDAYDARRSSEKPDIGLAPNSLIIKHNARKVTVDLLGRLRWARD